MRDGLDDDSPPPPSSGPLARMYDATRAQATAARHRRLQWLVLRCALRRARRYYLMLDKYTKIVLTVIAITLVWLCLWGPGPHWGAPAGAAANVVDVNIEEVGGKSIKSNHGVPVEGARCLLYTSPSPRDRG